MKSVYDPTRQLLETWDGVGTGLARREAAYSYNGNGGKTSLTDARGYRAEMSYDGHDRQKRWIFPSKTTPGAADPADFEEYAYDANGNRIAMRKRDGGVLVYTYDALNRMVIKETPGNLANVRYAYDLRGLQTLAWYTGNDWSVGHSYDGFGRMVSTTTNMGGFSRTVSHGYDRDGRRTELTFPDTQKFWTSRDGLGRTGAVYQGALGSTSTVMVAFAYNWASQLYYFARRFGDASVYHWAAGVGILDKAGKLLKLQQTAARAENAARAARASAERARGFQRQVRTAQQLRRAQAAQAAARRSTRKTVAGGVGGELAVRAVNKGTPPVKPPSEQTGVRGRNEDGETPRSP